MEPWQRRTGIPANGPLRLIIRTALSCIAVYFLLVPPIYGQVATDIRDSQSAKQCTGATDKAICPFHVYVPEEALIDLHRRLAATRWPEQDLEGTLEYQIEGKPPATYKAGDVLFIPAGTIHWGKNVGSGNGAELATYWSRKGSRSLRWPNERPVRPILQVSARLQQI